jgi:hypothetical protein
MLVSHSFYPLGYMWGTVTTIILHQHYLKLFFAVSVLPARYLFKHPVLPGFSSIDI